MSELTLYRPAPATQACVRSFALASEAPKISMKDEALILSRLMSAALGYRASFWRYLNDHHDAPVTECQMLARRAKRRGFLERAGIPADDHADVVMEAELLFERLDYYAQKHDEEYKTDTGLRSLIAVGPAFIREQDRARKKSWENGLPAIRYVNPFVAVNVASVVNFDIFKDIEFGQPHRSKSDLQYSITPLYAYVDSVRNEYPVHLSPQMADPSQSDSVRAAIYGIYTSLEDHICDPLDILDAETAKAAYAGLRCVQNYLSPFVQNISASRDYSQEARILTFSEWGPLALAAREKRAAREERQRANPELFLPRND